MIYMERTVQLLQKIGRLNATEFQNLTKSGEVKVIEGGSYLKIKD